MIESGSGTHTERDFRLHGGAVLPQADIAWISRGRLAADGGNAVLVAHGYTSSHRFIEPGSAAAEGSWSELVGPGRAIDTDRFFVVSSNVLGSCYGSSGPGSLDPHSGQPYGSAFPAISFLDIARAQRCLLDALGVQRLHAVVGVSMGGFQTLQWGLQYPDQVDRLVVALSALEGGFLRSPGVDALSQALAACPHWRDGRPAAGAMVPFLTDLRIDTLRRYGMDAWLSAQGMDTAQREDALHAMATPWAQGFDAHALLVLRRAIVAFDARPSLAAIRARLLLVLSTTDSIFPASGAPTVMQTLHDAGVQASFHPLHSPYGHLASGLDWQGWSEALRRFLD